MSAPAAEDPPDEMLVERQVDNASMDEAIRRYTAEHMTEASAKVRRCRPWSLAGPQTCHMRASLAELWHSSPQRPHTRTRNP